MALISPKDAVCKDILLKQHKPVEYEFDNFKKLLGNLKTAMLDNAEADEKYNEAKAAEFLKNAFYNSTNYIGKPVKGDIDLVITEDTKAKSDVRVIIEAKRVSADKAQFPSADGEINVKALQETVLYYLRESIGKKNKGIRRIVITNALEWFIFDAKDFETFFITGNKKLRKDFEDYEAGRLSFSNDTTKFYSEIAKPAIDEVKDKLNYVYFDIKQLSKTDELFVYKILSPYYLLKKPCATDSNVLNDKFYKELLHIIGLYENDKDEDGKPKAKTTIERLPADKRESGTMLENAITQLSYKSPFNLFDRAIQLVIVWINRILFLKLLEAQLVKWHNGDKNYKFLTYENLSEYDDLKELFFGVIARRPTNREPGLEKYKYIPYLNSSLFEQTEEMDISGLKDKVEITVHKNTVLKGEGGSKMNPLKYLLRFLDAYDFGATESEDGLRKDSKTLINASVLGLIFEKINGYKDGSFYTPGFITQYMCHSILERAVVNKFNKAKGWECQTLKDVKNQCRENGIGIDDKNKIINSIRICDPAVGSGHFLVSALNELIRIKYELGALCSTNGELLDGNLKIENDELFITYDDGKEFVYNPLNAKSQKIQETLFNEKRTIIENCLFGVDINHNSVNICRLRLWIELLKNAYYYSDNDGNQILETLPNIDINIKCRNSLVSRYSTDVEISNILEKKVLDEYKDRVKTYKDAPNKTVKHELEGIIEQLKDKFKESVKQSSDDYRKYQKAQKELSDLTSPQLFELTKKEKKKLEERIKESKKKIAEYEENQKNSIYENAMEWRFEFPEVLNDNGDYIGFDVIIGNPPYIDSETMTATMPELRKKYADTYQCAKGNWDIYVLFFELGMNRLNSDGILSFIVPNKWVSIDYAQTLREKYFDTIFEIVDCHNIKVFEAGNDPTIVSLLKKGSDVIDISSFETNNICKFIQDVAKDKTNTSNLGMCISPHISILMHILSQNNVVKNYVDVENPFTTGEAYELISLISDNLKDSFKLINTGTIDSYISLWGIKPIAYLKNKYTYPCVSKEDFATKFPRRLRQACAPKIIITGMRHFECYYDESGDYIAGKSTVILLNEKYSQAFKYLLGILNSKIISFFIKGSYSTLGIGGGINFSKDMIESLPIPSATSDQQQSIIDLVDQILADKKQDPQANTSELEDKIDDLVYELYGLSPEEIAVVKEE